jgi:hypothetical protein
MGHESAFPIKKGRFHSRGNGLLEEFSACGGNYRYDPLIDESDDSIRQGEERVIFSASHVHAGVKTGAPLTDDDRTRPHDLAPETFDTQPLGIALAPVAGGTHSLFMRH